MCGIVGYNGKCKCVPYILNCLETLEYRGYDSAGIAVLNDKTKIIKEKGRIENLKKKINLNEEAYIGIGHTRWATHGKPSKENSHPHKVGIITIVHNGIIENYQELKEELKEYNFKSETDSEVVAALIDKLYKQNNDMLKTLNELNNKLIGSYALGILVDGDSKLYTIRKDSPLIIGVSDIGNFIASDVPAILKYTNKYYSLLNEEYAVIEKEKVTIYHNLKKVNKKLKTFEFNVNSSELNGYEHYMLKEIYEQPKVIKETIKEYTKNIELFFTKFKGIEKYTDIDIIGCGSAYYVGVVGKYLINKYGKINVNTYIASEYRYTEHIYSKKHLVILISQSGETADTLAVLRKVKDLNIDTLAIVNAYGSSIANEADKVLYIKAGPEIAVATTKAYTCQFIILSLLATYLGIKNNTLDKKIINEYKNIDKKLEKLLKNNKDTLEIANSIYKAKDLFYIGRKIDYSLCLEASLKLKEISYIHSEAYMAGELKHGTISLIEKNTPVISIITDDDIRLKTISNVKEIKARGAYSIIITNEDILDNNLYDKIITIPKEIDLIEPLFVIIKCQLIAYYTAKLNNYDIDKPKNLAKSVTVE